MKRNQTIIAVLLTILALAFIVFVALMQNNFNNPEFDQLTVTTIGNTETSEEDEQVDDESVAGAAGSVVGDDEEEDAENEADTDTDTEETDADSDEEQTDVVTSTQTVEAETLNAREGPGIEYDITGVLEAGQVVTVEDSGNDWVKIITSEFEGYVNKNYLSGE